MKNNGRNPSAFYLVGLILALPYTLVSYLDIHNGVMIALFVSVVILWFSELIPLAATGLLVPCLAVLYGVADVKQAFGAFGNQILFLFIGAFLLGKAMQKHGWDRRIAFFILSSKAGCRSPETLALFLALICWFLSMWISNTASCVIMVPIALGILNTLRDNFEDEADFKRFSIRLLLICAFASSIGGLATPVGTPPNLLAIQFLFDKGIDISFIGWMFVGMPVSLAMLAVLLVILRLRFSVPSMHLEQVRVQFVEELKGLGKIRIEEIQVAVCFVLAVTLWIAPGILTMLWPDSTWITELKSRLPMGGVAILAALILFCLPVKTKDHKLSRNLLWEDAKDIDWGTVLLFGGGLCLGTLLNQTGLAREIGQEVFNADTSSLWVLGCFAIVTAILMSEFSSNTASTAIILPIVIASFASLGDEVLTQLVIATAFGASYGFMLPVSTPPNAIVYGTGRIPLQQMVRAGIIFDISGFVVIAVMMFWFLPLLGII